MDKCDFLIIGGGIIGISIARELKKRHPRKTLLLIEKEKGYGLHASGRNSGVLHAGFYYTADSFKAKFTQAGNQRLTEYCESRISQSTNVANSSLPKTSLNYLN